MCMLMVKFKKVFLSSCTMPYTSNLLITISWDGKIYRNVYFTINVLSIKRALHFWLDRHFTWNCFQLLFIFHYAVYPFWNNKQKNLGKTEFINKDRKISKKKPSTKPIKTSLKIQKICWTFSCFQLKSKQNQHIKWSFLKQKAPIMTT